MIPTPAALQFGQSARRLRIDTLSRLRWLALFGQLTTVLATVFLLKFPLPLGLYSRRHRRVRPVEHRLSCSSKEKPASFRWTRDRVFGL